MAKGKTQSHQSSEVPPLEVRESEPGFIAESELRDDVGIEWDDSKDHLRPTDFIVPEGPDQEGAPPAPNVAETDFEQTIEARVRATPTPIIARNMALPRSVTGSGGHEPSVASADNQVFLTGNWFAAYSRDGGDTFAYINPKKPDYQGDAWSPLFCCDQVVHYVPTIDSFIWLRQYVRNRAGENIQRLKYISSRDLSGGGSWKLVDISPRLIGFPGRWLDFPAVAISRNYLYIASYLFVGGESGAIYVMMRASLDSLRQGAPRFEHFAYGNTFGGFCPVQNCGTTMYWGSHLNTHTIRLFSWADGSSSVNSTDIQVPPWPNASRVSFSPDGSNWLGWADDRILGATTIRDQVVFAWVPSAGGTQQRPRPYIRLVLVDPGSQSYVSSSDIWNSKSAFAYPSLTSNPTTGQVGMACAFGGGPRYPEFAVGLLSGLAENERALKLVAAGSGARSRWGDYLTARCHYSRTQPTMFSAAGFVVDRSRKGETHYCNFN